MNEFLREAVTEGVALRDLIDYYATEGGHAIEAVGRMFRSGGYRRVTFAGMGSSFCAPFCILDYLIASGIPAIAPNAYKLSHDRATLITSDTLMIAISKSGTTGEILSLVQGIDADAGLIAVVNQPESALAAHCKVLLPMKVGSETQIASKSFLCTLAVLNLIAMELTGTPHRELFDPLRDIARWICTYLAAAVQWKTTPLLATVEGCTYVDILACGASFSTAYKSALVLREVPQIMATAIDCADYAHGWAKAIRSGYVGIVLAPEYREQSIEARAVKQILDRGGKVILVSGTHTSPREGLTLAYHPPLPERLAPLVQVAICDAMIGAMAA